MRRARFAKARVAVCGSRLRLLAPPRRDRRKWMSLRNASDAGFGGPRTVNHEHGQADVVVGVFVVHAAASDTRGKKEVSGWDRFLGDLEVLGTRETHLARDVFRGRTSGSSRPGRSAPRAAQGHRSSSTLAESPWSGPSSRATACSRRTDPHRGTPRRLFPASRSRRSRANVMNASSLRTWSFSCTPRWLSVATRIRSASGSPEAPPPVMAADERRAGRVRCEGGVVFRFP